jgi:hypothetical protein
VVVGSAPPCVPPSAIPFGDVAAKLPHGMSMPPGSRLLQVEEKDGTTTVTGETDLGITPLQAVFRRQLLAAGRDIFLEDNEGREAELYFTLPGGSFGVVRETRARCPVGVTRFSVETG